MRDIFRFCFEQITDPLTLPLNPFWEWIILTFLHEVVYRIAFDKVGVLYRAGIISGRLAGSFLHWLLSLRRIEDFSILVFELLKYISNS